jgi:hypothetical protein
MAEIETVPRVAVALTPEGPTDKELARDEAVQVPSFVEYVRFPIRISVL